MGAKSTMCPVCKVRINQDAQHLRSFQHLHAAEIRLLLANPLIHISDVARKFGVSRQRAYQVVMKLKAPFATTDERRMCKARAEIEKVPSFRFLFGLKEYGITLEPVLIRRAARVYAASRRLVKINGVLCLIRRACQPPSVLLWGDDYVSLPPVNLRSSWNQGVKFVIYHIPDGSSAAGNVIIPVKALKGITNSIVAKVGEYKYGYPRAGQAPWREYLNNWSALLQRGSAPLGTPRRLEKSAVA